tara:strand:- start:2629 stop:4152 length:1524 start_codon:yes stop_codon:yes gene_type:complete
MLEYKGQIILHPFLISLFPIFFLFSLNVHEVPINDIFFPIIISISITFVAWIILRKIFDGVKAGNILSLFLLLFVTYGNIRVILNDTGDTNLQLFSSNLILGTIFLSIGILGIIFFRRTQENKKINSIFNVVAITIILILIMNVAIFFIENPIDSSYEYFQDIPLIKKDIQEKPDVFVFILDEFAGKKQLKMDFKYDLNSFNQSLLEREFQVPKTSLSNYPNTALSMPSLLNMDYLEFLTFDLDQKSKDMRIPLKLKDQNNVMKIFKLNGYDVVSFYGGLDATGDALIVNEKLCSFGTINTDLRKNFVLTYLPLSYFNDALLANFQNEKLQCVFSFIENYETDSSKPTYHHIHIRLPHHPFIYDSEGNHLAYQIKYDDKDAYLQQLKFTEKKILELVDIIQKKSPESVIIILSDHGFRPDIDWETPSDDDYIRGFNVITSFYFPDKNFVINEKISLVNVYRIFFNEYFDYNFDILPNKHFWYNPSNPYIHYDVTEKLETRILNDINN